MHFWLEVEVAALLVNLAFRMAVEVELVGIPRR